MGQKVNPRILRAVTTFEPQSRWFAVGTKNYTKALHEDIKIRRMIAKTFREGGVGQVVIERASQEVIITIHTSKPGVVIGRGGKLIEELKAKIKRQIYGSTKMKITVNIFEIRDSTSNAEIMVQNIRDQIEKRVPFRRAMKRTMEQIIGSEGVQGCRVQVSGRLNGVEIARREMLTRGRLPLHTLRANIDYSRGAATTLYGTIGIKVWIYKGDVFAGEQPKQQQPKRRVPAKRAKRRTLETGGKKLFLRKKAQISKEKTD